jgi:hypothetical protein
VRASALWFFAYSSGGPGRAKWFELVFGRGDEREEDIGDKRLPRDSSPLIGALSDAAKQRQDRVGDAAQDRDDESRSRIAFDPRMVVLGESGVEDLVRRFDAPVATGNEQPMLSGQADARQLEMR